MENSRHNSNSSLQIRILEELEKSSFEIPYSYHMLEKEVESLNSLICLVMTDGEILELDHYAKKFPEDQTEAFRFHESGIAGYLIARVMVVDNTVDILRIATLKDYRHKGFARSLLDYLEKETGNFLDRPMFILLEVSEVNTAAIHLYGSTGYEIIHRRKNYYADSSAAIIMRKTIL